MAVMTVRSKGGVGHVVSDLRVLVDAVRVGIIVKLPEKSLAKWAVDRAIFRIKFSGYDKFAWILRNDP
jgi:hypothetical protein